MEWMKHLLSYRWVYLYIVIIPIVNLSFTLVPTLPMPDGGMWAPFAIVTGLVLVLRDLAQREVGHYIFIPLVIGIAFSYVLAGPEIAFASATAFAISELADWAVYTFSKRPLSQRILLSSAIGAPIDSAVFFFLADSIVPGIFAWSTVLTSIASKLFGAYVVSVMIRRREQRVQAVAG